MDDAPQRKKRPWILEVGLVILVFFIVASLIVPKVGSDHGSAKRASVLREDEILAESLRRFHLDYGRYPTTSEGLDALVSAPPGKVSLLKNKSLKEPPPSRKPTRPTLKGSNNLAQGCARRYPGSGGNTPKFQGPKGPRPAGRHHQFSHIGHGQSPPYLRRQGQKAPLDPWGNPYIYQSPGTDGTPDSFTITSYGPTGKPGGTDENAPIVDTE